MLYGDILLKHDFLAFSMKFELKGNKIWKNPVIQKLGEWGEGSIWSDCYVF